MKYFVVICWLLYGTGMRASEALSLLSGDVNLEDNYLILRNCKNGKDRLIPMAGSLVEVCREYLKYRNHYAQLNPYVSDRFFISPNGSACTHNEV